MAATTKFPIKRWPAVVTLGFVFFAMNPASAAQALRESECDGKFTRSTVTVSTQLLVGTADVPSYRVTWRLPGQPPLSTIVRPPPTGKHVGFAFSKWQGYVDQKEETARVSTPTGMEEVKLDCRRKPYARPQKRR